MHILLTLLLIAAAPFQQEIRDHADAILAHQLKDGAIVHIQDGDTITIRPYFGNYAALGLFEAYRVTRDRKYLDAAIRWTDWYLDHMGPTGVPSDYEGTREEYRPAQECTGVDSCAATFLMCADARRSLADEWRFVAREHGRLWRTYHAMMATADVDGLTYAAPACSGKLMMDNAEVYKGLAHGRLLARALRDYSWNQTAYYARRNMREGFRELRDENGFYPWAKAGAGDLRVVSETSEFYPAGLAQLFAIAIGPTTRREAKEVYRKTLERFPDIESCAADHLYWWVAAGHRVNDRSTAHRALAAMRGKVAARGLAVDHGHYIRALSLLKTGGPHRRGVPMGSTFAETPRGSLR